MLHPRLSSAILFFCAVAPSLAAGQTIPSPYTFIEHSQEWALFAGKTDLNPGQLGLGPRNATTFGGRYAVAFGGAAGLDVYGVLFKSTRDVLDVSRPVDDRLIGRSDFNAILAHLRLRINLTGQRAWRGFQPFVAFGGGLAATGFADRVLETTADMDRDSWFEFGPVFTGVFAAGTNFHISDKISLRIEADMNLWKLGTPAGWLTVEADELNENPESEWVSGKSITIGAAWRF